MNNSMELPDSNTIEAEAGDWIARLDRGGLSEEECLALREWIGRGPEYYALISRFAGIWSGLDGLEDILEEVKAPASVKRLYREQPGVITAVVAVFIISVIVGVMFTGRNHFQSSGVEASLEQASYSTGIGEQQTVTFQDGSRTLLNTDTSIAIDFNDQHRKVHLIKGEALFEIVSDESRSFLVYAGANAIYTLGTAFIVKMLEDQVEVTIREGQILIKPLPGSAQYYPGKYSYNPATVLKAGQAVIINEKIRLLKDIEAEEIDRKLAWSVGLIIFSGEPLSYVVEEISRYTPVKFIITDPELSELRIGGRFKIGETAGLREVLESGFGVNFNKAGNNLIYLSSARQE